MRKTSKQTKQVVETVIEDILCNKCGESCKTRIGNYEGVIEYSMTGGYDSHLGDNVEFIFSICERCLEKLFKEFKIPPDIKDHW